MTKAIEVRLKHPEFAPDGIWYWICHENDEGYVDDTMVYFYVHNDVKFEDWKVGDKIVLDDLDNGNIPDCKD